MDVSRILDELNDAQRQAVTAESGSQLVLAGAGSGKTRVLVHRIAWLIEVDQVSPFSILAVTFTNKAAAEMRGRIEQLLDYPTDNMWIGTFHGLTHRLLRRHWREAGLPQSFQIIDSDDQYRMIRRIMKDKQLDEAQFPPRSVQNFINARKDEGKRARSVDPQDNPHHRTLVEIYVEYEKTCQQGGLVDFAELLLRSHELWLENPALLEHYRERFKYILVDEFQDTNTIQYAWLRVLAGDNARVFIVGDDDQSIYGWRGAQVDNIQRCTKDFRDVDVIRLEQNYRSTGNILKAANELITHNQNRMGKNLWCDGDDGPLIKFYSAFNEIDEARFIADQIQQWCDEGQQASECAILYRSNAQSRLFEEALLQRNIPYRVYGGQRFFERAEIKDALAYLRIVANPNDDNAFERTVNHPPRGIGGRTLDAVRELALDSSLSLWESTKRLVETNVLTARATNALTGYVELVEHLVERNFDQTLSTQVENALKYSNLVQHFENDRDPKSESRVENLKELVSAASYFVNDDEEIDDLTAFLSQAALEAGDTQAAAWDDCVQMMTLHSAKGLEFDLVFMGGLEEGLFPGQKSIEDANRLEEERRLCYVGMTRAKHQLYICRAESRRLYGTNTFPKLSRFVSEIPLDYIEEVRLQGTIAKPMANVRNSTVISQPNDFGYRVGQTVRHAKFGEGVILDVEGDGDKLRVHIRFGVVGCKWLMAAYASLEVV